MDSGLYFFPPCVYGALFSATIAVLYGEDTEDEEQKRKVVHQKGRSSSSLSMNRCSGTIDSKGKPLVLRSAEVDHVLSCLKKTQAGLEKKLKDNADKLSPAQRKGLEKRIADFQRLDRLWRKALQGYTIRLVPASERRQGVSANTCTATEEAKDKQLPAAVRVTYPEPQYEPGDHRDPMNQLYTNQPYASEPFKNKEPYRRPEGQPRILDLLAKL